MREEVGNSTSDTKHFMKNPVHFVTNKSAFYTIINSDAIASKHTCFADVLVDCVHNMCDPG